MPYLARPLSWLTILWLTLCCYLCAVHAAKPSRDPDMPNGINPSGEYVSYVHGRLVYRVTIRRTDEGPIVSQWVNVGSNTVSYIGYWTLHGEEWREVYAVHPDLLRSPTWRWRIVNTSPLAFEDQRGVDAGWSLTVPEPDF